MTTRTAGEQTGPGLRTHHGAGERACQATARHAAASGKGGRLRWFNGALMLAITMIVGACASASAPVIEDDIEVFTTGIDSMLQPGMSIREARHVLRERMPRPTLNTQVTSPVPSANRANRMRRYMIGWPTMSTGTTFVLTLFCDRDGKVVRWTTGPLTEDR